MIRKMMWAVLVVGVALIAAPFVMGLPDKAGGGQQMIDAFAPIMEEQNVELTAAYYYDVFVPLGDVVPAMTQENIDKFLEIMDDPKNHPVLVHCEHGIGRTGLIVSIFRMEYDHWLDRPERKAAFLHLQSGESFTPGARRAEFEPTLKRLGHSDAEIDQMLPPTP